jgi:putative addiction module killer protein
MKNSGVSPDLTTSSLKATVMTAFNTPKEIVLFRAHDGRVPFEEWLDDLADKRAVARVLARLARVRQGNLGDCKPVGEGVSELRVDYGPGYRVYFGQKGQTLIVLLCGGDKRTQDRDIRLARQFWQEFKSSES